MDELRDARNQRKYNNAKIPITAFGLNLATIFHDDKTVTNDFRLFAGSSLAICELNLILKIY